MNKAFEKILVRLKEEKRKRVKYIANGEPEKIKSMNEFNMLQDVIKIIEEVAEEYNGGWIPCSERLPEERDWYLAVFQEADTGFIGLPFISDYLMGAHTKYTTEDGWIIANCTDIEEDRAEYYKKLKCVAWQPLPEPYKERD